LTHTFLVLVTVGLDRGVCRKLYTLIGGQRAEKFKTHWLRAKSDIFGSTITIRKTRFHLTKATKGVRGRSAFRTSAMSA